MDIFIYFLIHVIIMANAILIIIDKRTYFTKYIEYISRFVSIYVYVLENNLNIIIHNEFENKFSNEIGRASCRERV